jgi:hypothetical protein
MAGGRHPPGLGMGHDQALGVEAHHRAFTPDGSEAWITDHTTSEAFVLDAEAVEREETIRLARAPHHLAITPDGAPRSDHDNGQLIVFDVPSREQIHTIDVGKGPHGVWAAPRARTGSSARRRVHNELGRGAEW